MKKPTKSKTKGKKSKYSKTPKLNMPFDEVMRRIARVDRDELDREKDTGRSRDREDLDKRNS